MSQQLFNPGESGRAAFEPKGLAEALLSPSLLEALPDAMLAVNQAGFVVQINSRTEHLFGYTRDELIGQRIEILVPERQRWQHHQHRDGFAQHPKTRRMGVQLDPYGRRRDGSEFPVEISLSPVPTDNGLLVLSAIRDISDRKRIEEQLRRAHEELDRKLRELQSRLALIVDSSQDAVIGKNLDGVITHWNKGAERLYGYTSGEVIGKSISILAPKDRTDEIPAILEKIRRGERVEYFESVRVTKSGRPLNVSISVSPIFDTGGAVVGASAIARDITAQKRAEDELRQAQKMEAVIRLAAGVAHDFNNILGIITTCADLLREKVATQSKAKEYIDNIRKAAVRGAALTRQFLAFSRRQPAQCQVLDLNERMKEVSKLLRPLMGEDVQISLLPGPTPAIVEADPNQLDQIVMNLAVNALDAMPDGGKLIVETATKELDAAFAELHLPMKPGKYAMLAISDNGCGMDSDTVSHLFEPFIPTQEAGKGTGLGLATVYAIVKQHQGHIWVHSNPGRGTTFKVYLPCADHKIGLATQPDKETLPPRHEGATVLLVEDEALMRKLTRQTLEEQGYCVLEAADGKSALDLLASNPTRVDLALTDVVMPGMSGPELILRLTESRPSMKIVYMSGYSGELIADHDALQSGITFLNKPFTRAALLKTIHSALQ
jgi:PAS domain S-box-containing protein